jgi:hypothetical protein
VRLEDVRVDNAGVDYDAPSNRFWEHRVSRREACEIVLEGRSEFEARGVTISGAARFVVPDGYRMRVCADASAERGYRSMLTPLGETPLWTWAYALADDGTISLTMQDDSAEALIQSSASRTAAR